MPIAINISPEDWKLKMYMNSFIILVLLVCSIELKAQQMSINTDGSLPDSSAMLDIKSTTQGFLMPRMTTAQQAAIVNPAEGLMIYNITDSAYYFYNGSSWSNSNLGAKSIVPVGTILTYGGDTNAIPNGYLLCNGLAIDTTLYNPLFHSIGYAWGGSGASFNIPDLRGRFLRGTDLGAGNDPDATSRTAISIGGNTGDEVGSVQTDQVKSHSHNLWRNLSSGNSGDNAVSYPNVGVIGEATGSDGWIGSMIQNTGGNETRPKNANVNFIICFDSEIAQAGGTSTAGSLTQTLNFASPNLSITGGNSVDLSSLSAGLNTQNLDSVLSVGNDAGGDTIVNIGALGIGTSTPSQLLDVTGTAEIDSLRINNSFAFPTMDGNSGQVLQTNGSGNVTWETLASGADDLGNHIATQNIELNGNRLSNDGGNEGITIDNNGNATISGTSMGQVLSLNGFVRTNGQGSGLELTNDQISITGNNGNTGDMIFETGATNRMRLTSNGFLGIGNTNPTQTLDVTGTAEIDSLRINNNYAFPKTDGASGDYLRTNGSGNVTWEPLIATLSGGSANKLTRWSTATTIDTSLITDNGFTVGVNTAPAATDLLRSTTNDASIFRALSGIHSLSSSDITYGVYGSSSSSDNNNAAGVYGTASNGAVAVYGQNGSSLSGTVAVKGWNAAGGSNQNFGVKGQTSSTHPSSAGIYGFGFHGGNAILAESNARVIEAESFGTRTSSFNAIELNNLATSTTASIIKTGINIQSTGAWTGASAQNIGLNVNVAGGTTNYAALFTGGNVGIGITSPSAKLEVAGRTITDTLEIDGLYTLPSAAPTTSGQSIFYNGTSVVWGSGAVSSPFTNSGTNTYLSQGSRVGIGTNTVTTDYVTEIASSGGGDPRLLKLSNDANTNAVKTGLEIHISDKGNDKKYATISEVIGKTNQADSLFGHHVTITPDRDATSPVASAFYSKFSGSDGATYGIYSKNEKYNYFSGNVGIGTLAATNPLHVSSPLVDAMIRLNQETASYTSEIVFADQGTAKYTFGSSYDTHAWGEGMFFYNIDRSIADLFIDGDNGNVGIGITNPSQKLQIVQGGSGLRVGSGNAGDVFLSGFADFGGTLSANAYSDGTTWNRLNTSFAAYMIDIGVSNDYIDFKRSAPAANPINNFTSLMRIDGDGNVGIGTSSPNQKLHLYDSGSETAMLFNNSSTGSGLQDGLYVGYGSGDGYMWNYEASSLILGTFDSERMRISSNGNVGIGTTSPSQKLHVIGNILASGTITPSDERLKTEITPITNVLSTLDSITGVYHYWDTINFTDRGFTSERAIGVIAQKIQKIYPELVIENDDGYLAVDYSKFTAVLLQAIKEQQTEIETLNSKYDNLLTRIQHLEN